MTLPSQSNRYRDIGIFSTLQFFILITDRGVKEGETYLLGQVKSGYFSSV